MRITDEQMAELRALPNGVFYPSQVKAVAAVEPTRHVVVWHADNSTTRYDDDSQPIAYTQGDEIEVVPAANDRYR